VLNSPTITPAYLTAKIVQKIASDYIVSVETDKTVGIVREGLAKGAFGIRRELFRIADAHRDVGSLFCQRTTQCLFRT